MFNSLKLNLLMSSLLIVFISGCSKSAEEMCVEAQMNFYDQAKPKSKRITICPSLASATAIALMNAVEPAKP